MKKFIQAVLLCGFSALSLTAFAGGSNCELPPDIDDGKTYFLQIDGYNNSKSFPIKIVDIEDCWIQTFRQDGDHLWLPISRLISISSEGK